MTKLKTIVLTNFISSLFFLSGCTTSEETVALTPTSGFGGTGYRPSGFGGTGIVGTITDFGSIWVNGVEVEYDDNTVVTSLLTEKETLELGKQVVLETMLDNDKTVTRKITIYYPVAGKVTKISKEEMIINDNIFVKINQAKKDDGVQLKLGEYVAISGYKISPRTWVATRVNKNLGHKSFYQETPNIEFTKSIKKVSIESSISQLKKWKALLSGVAENVSTKYQRILIMGTVENGKIHVESVHAYNRAVKSASKRIGLKKRTKRLSRPQKKHGPGFNEKNNSSGSGSKGGWH